MSTATPTPSATAEPSGAIGTLKKNSLGARGITFLVVSAAAPLTVIAGTVPLAILIAGPAAPRPTSSSASRWRSSPSVSWR